MSSLSDIQTLFFYLTAFVYVSLLEFGSNLHLIYRLSILFEISSY